jgi:23S rRNA pseudouridine2605 synthase
MKERLQKILSAAGICSRRAAEEYITAGRVTVNGAVASLGDGADLTCDAVAVDGVALKAPGGRTCLMLYKPRGYITTLSDQHGRKTVAELVAGCGVRVWPVGRLDLDSEGLLLMTDDGAMTQRILHPSHEVEKEYYTWVTGDVTAALSILSAPMELDGERLRPAAVRVVKADGETALLSIVIHEGKNRQVRRMCAAARLTVTRLKRVREGTLKLDEALMPGEWRRLKADEISQLY